MWCEVAAGHIVRHQSIQNAQHSLVWYVQTSPHKLGVQGAKHPCRGLGCPQKLSLSLDLPPQEASYEWMSDYYAYKIEIYIYLSTEGGLDQTMLTIGHALS